MYIHFLLGKGNYILSNTSPGIIRITHQAIDYMCMQIRVY